MKRTWGILGLFVALVLSGCFSTPEVTPEEKAAQFAKVYAEISAISEVYDASVPAEQQCILNILGGQISVYEFDGKAVEWYIFSAKKDFNVKIPAGEHTLKVEIKEFLKKTDMGEVTFTFEPGELYALDLMTTGKYSPIFYLIKFVNLRNAEARVTTREQRFPRFNWGIGEKDKSVMN